MKRKPGRPQQTDGLRVKILDALKVHPASPGGLAQQLSVTRNAVNCALFRMKGLVVRLGPALYTVPKEGQGAASRKGDRDTDSL